MNLRVRARPAADGRGSPSGTPEPAVAHRPVLLHESVAALLASDFDGRRAPASLPPGLSGRGAYVDGTFGRGGHSRLLLSCLDAQSRLLVFDKDPQAIAEARALSEADARVIVAHRGFGGVAEEVADQGIGPLQGVLLDLGVSSPQLDEADRGFSFMRDGPLDMRMDTSRGMTAAQWLAEADVQDMKEVIAGYGEERFALKIAKAIAASRESGPLRTTSDLAQLVARTVGWREKGQHPATRTFQAVRIYINRELEELAHALASLLTLLAPGGRLAVISFHSLEDRMVKQAMAWAAQPARAQARLPIAEKDLQQPWLRLLGRTRPGDEEVAQNPRARSAILRVAERTAEPFGPAQERALREQLLATQGRAQAAGRGAPW